MKTYHVIGVMSGTSLDGLDIAYCKFSEKNNKWKFLIQNAETIKYHTEWKKKLSEVENKQAFDIVQIHTEYGHYIGKQIAKFITKHKIKADFIASHGHTIFHQPFKKITFQIGSGASIAAETRLPVVCDFRSLDVALDGQGAPLVPIGDQLLFATYGYCLNLGGFSNISFEYQKKRIAFDICPANIAINHLCKPLGKDFDNKGKEAKKGKINKQLLDELNNLKYYHLPKNKSKSLGKEWVIKNFYPILKKYNISIHDQLRTLTEHIAIQIVNSTNSNQHSTILTTGGGTYNTFLIERIKTLIKHNMIIPEKKTIEFKEALIFAFLGILRMRKEINCLKSVTGAKADNVGGAVYWG